MPAEKRPLLNPGSPAEQIKNGHTYSQPVGHLIQDNRPAAVSNGTLDLYPPVDGPRVHHLEIGIFLQMVHLDPESFMVLTQTREQICDSTDSFHMNSVC